MQVEKTEKQYKNARDRFEEIAITFGISDFRLDKNKRYMNTTTHKFYSIYKIGRSDEYMGFGNHFVIGKVGSDHGERIISFSHKPRLHGSFTIAKEEQVRLAIENPNNTFILYKSVRARKYEDDRNKFESISPAKLEERLDIGKPKFYYVDDGFGNMIKNEYHTRLSVYFYCFDNEIIR